MTDPRPAQDSDRSASRGADQQPDADAELDARRLRAPVRVGLVGVPIALLAAGVTGFLGLPGEVGGAVFLTLLALVAGIAGAVVAVGLVVDQVRGHRASLRRVLLTGGLLLVTLLLLIASAGAMLTAARSGA